MIVTIIVVVPITLLIGAVIRPRVDALKKAVFLSFHKDYNRELGKPQLELISQKTSMLMVYKIDNKLSVPFYISCCLFFLLLFVLSALPIFLLAFGGVEFLQTKLQPPVHWGTQQSFQIFEPIVSAIFILLVWLFLAWTLFILLGNLWRQLRHYAVLEIEQEKPRDRVEEKIIHLIRGNYFQLRSSTTEQELINAIFNIRNGTAFRGLGVSIILASLFVFLDAYTFTRVSLNKIEHRPYFSNKVTDYTFADIETINRTCHVYLKKGEIVASFNYRLALSDGRKISIIKGTDSSSRQLRAAYMIQKANTMTRSPVEYSSDNLRKSKANYLNCRMLLLNQLPNYGSGFVETLLK